MLHGITFLPNGFSPFSSLKMNLIWMLSKSLLILRKHLITEEETSCLKELLKTIPISLQGSFKGELLLGDLPVQFMYSVKSEENTLFGLFLEFSSATEERKSVLLASWGKNQSSTKFGEVIASNQVKRPETALGWFIQETSIEMNGYTITGIGVVCYKPQPKNRRLELDSTSAIQDNGLSGSPAKYFVILSDLFIKTTSQNFSFASFA